MPATYEPIASTTLGSPATSITLSSIPATYSDLRLVAWVKFSSTANTALVRFNSDSGNNYGYQYLYSGGSSIGASRSNPESRIQVDATNGFITTDFGMWEMDIFDYTSSNNKVMIDKLTQDYNTTGGAVTRYARSWRNSAAISSLNMFRQDGGDFATGTIITLWGILRA